MKLFHHQLNIASIITNTTGVTSVICTISAILASLFCLTCISFAYADPLSPEIPFNVSIDAGIEVSVPSTLELPITPSTNGTYASKPLNIAVSTNNITGYTLTMHNDSSNLVHNSDSTITIPTLDNEVDKASFPLNKWGYSLDDNTYKPIIAASSSSDTTLKTTNTYGNTDTTTINLATKVDLTKPAGTYTNTFVFTATTNQSIFTITWNPGEGTVSPTTTSRIYGSKLGTLPTTTRTGYDFVGWFTQAEGGEEITAETTVTEDTTYYAHWENYDCRKDSSIASNYTMQNIANLKSSAFATQGTQVKLCDTRDGKAYYAAKQADGNIWMTQNLDLDLNSNTEYTHADTDLGWTTGDATATWTPERSTIVGINYSPSTWTDDYNTPYSWDPGHYQILDSYSISSDCTNKDFSQCDNGVTLAASEGEANHYHVGNLYNWSAAVANNDTLSKTSNYTTMPDSICPAGWKLPNGMTGSGTTGMYGKLLKDSGIVTAYSTSTSSVTWSTDGETLIFQNPLYLVRGGRISSGSVGYVGTRGNYWSSSVRASSNAYYLLFNSSIIYPQNYNSRYAGFSVRCVAR